MCGTLVLYIGVWAFLSLVNLEQYFKYEKAFLHRSILFLQITRLSMSCESDITA